MFEMELNGRCFVVSTGNSYKVRKTATGGPNHSGKRKNGALIVSVSGLGPSRARLLVVTSLIVTSIANSEPAGNGGEESCVQEAEGVELPVAHHLLSNTGFLLDYPALQSWLRCHLCLDGVESNLEDFP
ncbi:hypothetical protein IF1G_01893 [Cordyceps javanica]|uniref:Uncharacterized protein n=1 Tax=Cordyceps javanica TaxID=43265 RepID=A0A545VD86_9HYPO|nr:hypothetical protein IF1G_01893 [Cordyceps javanica]